MPELPEVETVCRGLAQKIAGARIIHAAVRRPDLRRPFPPGLASRLAGARIDAIRRRAKYIVIDLSGGDSLIVHLGMSGRILIHEKEAARLKHDHLVIDTDDGRQTVLNDARRFGMVDICATGALDDHPFFKHLGPEPLSNSFSPAWLERAFAKKTVSVKNALLDQRIIAGIGNIYASEALYVAGIDPRRPAGSLTPHDISRLVPAIRAVLEKAIAAGGSSLKDYVQSSGELGYFQHHWAVYGKAGQACPDCSCTLAETGGILKITQGGRSTFYCPRRQN